MAEFRNIHTRIWTDTWVSELVPDEKLLFIYLFSNPNASICGLYELPKKNIALDTGISLDRVSQILDTFAEAKKVYYDNGLVWVVNLKKYNDSGDSIKIQERIRKDLETISDCDLKRRYYAFINIPYPEPKIPYPEKGSEKRRDETNPKRDGDETETLILATSELVQKAAEQITGKMPAGVSDLDALEQIAAMKPIKVDLKNGYQWLCDNHKTFKYYGQLVGPTHTAMAQRLQKANGGRSEPPKPKQRVVVDPDGGQHIEPIPEEEQV